MHGQTFDIGVNFYKAVRFAPLFKLLSLPHICHIGMFCKIRNKLPFDILKQLYFAFVHPQINYGYGSVLQLM